MRARVDPTRCQGYAICVELAPKHFVFDDWGFVQAVQVDADGDHLATVTKAVDRCPIKAIRWIDSPPTAAVVDPRSDEPVRPV
jgi:ferredoxin